MALIPVEYMSVCSVEIHTHLHYLVNGICFIHKISSSILNCSASSASPRIKKPPRCWVVGSSGRKACSEFQSPHGIAWCPRTCLCSGPCFPALGLWPLTGPLTSQLTVFGTPCANCHLLLKASWIGAQEGYGLTTALGLPQNLWMARLLLPPFTREKAGQDWRDTPRLPWSLPQVWVKPLRSLTSLMELCLFRPFQEASWKGRSGFWELTSSGRACPQAWKHSSTPSSLRVLTEVEEPEARTCTDLIIWHKLRAEADWPNKTLSLTTAGLGRPCMQFTANFRKRFQMKRKQQINSQGWFLPSLFFNNLNINTS